MSTGRRPRRGAPDRVVVRPGPLAGRVRVPGDKSLSHRALILGALAAGTVEVSGVVGSGDVRATAACLRRMGVAVELRPAGHGLAGTVTGTPGEPADVLDCGNSGTGMRLLAGVAAGVDGVSVLTGDDSLRRRPMDRVGDPLEAMGATVLGRGGGRLPPLVVAGGQLTGVDHVSGVASAQVKSCVLLAALGADGPTSVTSPARSRDHTERLLRRLGVDVTTERGADGEEIVRLHPARPTARPVTVPADPSSAAFWLVAAACGSSAVTTPDIATNPGRTGFLEVLGDLGADIDRDDQQPGGDVDLAAEPTGTVTVRPGLPGGATVAGEQVVDALDELVVLALAGAMSDGGLEVRDAAELRVKESDRIAAVSAALGELGVDVETRPDGYRAPGGQRPGPGTVEAGGDHRIAMTACIAGTVAAGPVEVRGMQAVTSSYPTFLDDLRALGGQVEIPD